MSPRGDQARAMVKVGVPPAEAFTIFTEEIDQWWRRGRRFRSAGARPGIIAIEPRVGGRMFESWERGDGRPPQVLQTGRVVEWEPPHRFVLHWRNANFAPHEHTEVEVVFEPSGQGTAVTVTHRGWASIRDDHPARHGRPVPAFIGGLGRWWGELLTSLREHADQST